MKTRHRSSRIAPPEGTRVNEELARERDFIAAVLDTLGAIVVVLDHNGRIVRANPGAGRLIGIPVDDMLGVGVFERFIPPDELAATRAVFARLVAGEPLVRYENDWLAGDGSHRRIAWANTSLLDGGEVRFVVATGVDITEQRRAESLLRDQARLLDEASDAILVRDLEHRLTYWSRGAERLYGWSAEEAVGRPTVDLGIYFDASDYLTAFETTLSAGHWSGELRQRTKAGERVVVQSRWTLVHDRDGRPASVLAINSDVTERKRLEQQLLRAQRLESIGTLAGGIAHDLNNVLSPILTSIQLLRRLETEDERSAALLDAVESSALRGADLVRQVLAFARGSGGERVPLQVAHVLRDALKILGETLPKSIELEFTIAPDLWAIRGDPTQIHQAIMNLCVNARDAMPHGGRLFVRAENVRIDEQYARMNPESKPGRYVRVAVTDTGTGIPAAILDRIFDPFFTTKEQGQGTGLGLSTVLGVVKGHDGFVSVQSEPLQGTEFVLHFPAAVIAPVEAEASETRDLETGNGELVLVVDDEEPIRAVTRATLETFGYRTAMACDGSEAVAVYAENMPSVHLVVLDLMMPVMDGSRTLRALERLDPHVKIVVSSGVAIKDDDPILASPRVKGRLVKPYTAHTLLKAVAAALATG
jgi:PAS domain S-box-containing protein